MSTEQFTDWFEGSVKPVRDGVYEITNVEPNGDRVAGFSYFDGTNWGLRSNSPDDAVLTYSMFGAEPAICPDIWRGLSEPAVEPEADLFAGSL